MSLTIERKIADNTVLTLTGRLDTVTAPELDKVLDEVILDTEELVFDLENLEYISSAGLRVLLRAQKTMNQGGSMKLQHVPANVREIFEITGFADFLTIE